MIFQIFLIAFGLFAILKTIRQYRAKKVSLYWLLLWCLLWLSVVIVALMPQTTDVLAEYVGVEKGADLLVYVAIVILFYSIYRILIRSEKQNKELTELVRKIAKLEAKRKD
ncbi:MAG: DUF2304 domain-containing protein [Patescibacteria group bacterium]|nr:DUF2304 domain-containing protein [Patescibacteria group bacterium]